MQVHYLWIPFGLFCFFGLITAGIFYLIPWGNQTRRQKGALAVLDRIVSVLMTAGLGDRTLTMTVHRRVAELRCRFTDEGAAVELPLVTLN